MWCGGGRRARCERDGAMWRGACALALLCAALAHADPEKRAEILQPVSPVPFVMGSRYGRSPPRAMSPRNDRFFMGSRYGKRAEGAAGGAGGAGEAARGGGRALLCEYTGVYSLYRCLSAPHPHYKRSSSDDGPGELL